MGCTTSAISTHSKDDFQLRYQMGPKVGEGTFAQVHVARRHKDNEICAVKVMSLEARNSKQLVAEEQAAWKAIGKHEHCVTLFETFHVQKLCFMVMEKCLSSMLDNISNLVEKQESELADIFYQMLSALSHCHKVHVVHRDVKPDNFLLAGQNGKTVKLCDFGLAAIQKSKPLKGIVGTPPYMSPEMVSLKEYNEKTDMWSYGVTVYLILFTQFPYMPSVTSSHYMKEAIRKGVPTIPFQRSDLFKHAPSKEAVAFAKSLLNRSAKTRCSAKEAMGHSFLREKGGKHTKLDSKQHDVSTDALMDTCHANVPFGDSTPTPIESTLKASFSEEFLEDQVTFNSGFTASGGSNTACGPALVKEFKRGSPEKMAAQVQWREDVIEI